MKLTVEFPSVSYREGPQGVLRLAWAGRNPSTRPSVKTSTRAGRAWTTRFACCAPGGGKRFYAEHDRVVARVVDLKAMGFEWVALNATAIFQAGARSVDAMIDALGALHTKIRGAVG